MAITFLDCTFRDGGYYNEWDFSVDLIERYLETMAATDVDVVELGFRTRKTTGFRGACAYSTDAFLNRLRVPSSLRVGVMINGAELLEDGVFEPEYLEELVPADERHSPVQVIRIACHIHEFAEVLPASERLAAKGYCVGFNLMQIAGREKDEVERLAAEASKFPLDVLYFADSLGSMAPSDVSEIISWLRAHWSGALGIHTHDNMGMALSNTLQAQSDGATWLDSTVTGMGRGPGNARTEELAIELQGQGIAKPNFVPLMALIREQFRPMRQRFGWGTNPYYFMAGKYGIHPTYVQEMLADSRYQEEDVLSVIEQLKNVDGRRYSPSRLQSAREFYRGEPSGTWSPSSLFEGREVLLLGTGPGVSIHGWAIQEYIQSAQPLVVALNTQSSIESKCIDVRVACHPVRVLADCDAHVALPQPLITPASMLPSDVRMALKGKELLDYGISVAEGTFVFEDNSCTLPGSQVLGYALAAATAGDATRILMAGFDGYGTDDPRTLEIQELLTTYSNHPEAKDLVAITPTSYSLAVRPVYSMRASA